MTQLITDLVLLVALSLVAAWGIYMAIWYPALANKDSARLRMRMLLQRHPIMKALREVGRALAEAGVSFGDLG